MGCLASTANENGYCERTRLWAISASWPPTACLWRSNIQAGVCGASLATAQARFFSLLVSRVVPTGTFRVTGEQGVKKTGLGIVPIDRDSTFHVLVVSTLQSLVASSEQNLAKFVNTYVQHLFRRDRD